MRHCPRDYVTGNLPRGLAGSSAVLNALLLLDSPDSKRYSSTHFHSSACLGTLSETLERTYLIRCPTDWRHAMLRESCAYSATQPIKARLRTTDQSWSEARNRAVRSTEKGKRPAKKVYPFGIRLSITTPAPLLYASGYSRLRTPGYPSPLGRQSEAERHIPYHWQKADNGTSQL
jgi:hypothetical protein